MIGMSDSDAMRAAVIIENTVLSLRVPMLRTVAEAILTISGTSSIASVMTGEPPAQMQTLAQSLTVT